MPKGLPRLKLPLRVRRTQPKDPAAQRKTQWRILIWSTLASLAVGFLGAGYPLEDFFGTVRDAIRRHPPSGQIIIVGIDDRSVEALGALPWPRERYARMIDELEAKGVRRIFIDIVFNAPSMKHGDRALIAAMQRSGNVALAGTFTTNRETGQRVLKLPLPAFRQNTGLASIALRYSGLAAIRELSYSARMGDAVVPSLSSWLAGVEGAPSETFPVDYSIDSFKIPSVSALDVVNGQAPASALRGKDVVIALASRELGDVYYMPGRGLANGANILVTGAETLREGRPLNLGWILPLIIGVALSAIHLFARRRLIGRAAIVAGLLGTFFLPLFTESHSIVFEVVPAAMVVCAVAVSQAWSNFRQSYKVRGNLNAISGLPNLNALREVRMEGDAVLVAARVRNFAEISSALPPEEERALVEQIVGRLKLGTHGTQIYQGDEGVFAWQSMPEVSGPDQLEALHALFRSPAMLNGRLIDLSVTFGIDSGVDRTLANRIGATLVAADEAAAEGLRWKAFDPAKLADAEWKLSLLGRLDAAIDTGEVWVAYQPQIELASGRLTGAEALVRWSHPEKGDVSPIEFVLAAEQHDRIDKLTEFVLTDAIKAAASLNMRGHAFDVAVNISARLLEKPGLVHLVRRLLLDFGLPSERLTLEVTESAAMASGRTSIRTLEEIGSLGINVSIDDYGTGFSTLEYFKKIPATEVKIDRSFIAAIDRSPSDRLMVRSTIELAHSVGRIVVAEGVETSEILDELTKLGCDKAQGYLIGKPMKLLNLTKLLLEQRRKRA